MYSSSAYVLSLCTYAAPDIFIVTRAAYKTKRRQERITQPPHSNIQKPKSLHVNICYCLSHFLHLLSVGPAGTAEWSKYGNSY